MTALDKGFMTFNKKVKTLVMKPYSPSIGPFFTKNMSFNVTYTFGKCTFSKGIFLYSYSRKGPFNRGRISRKLNAYGIASMVFLKDNNVQLKKKESPLIIVTFVIKPVVFINKNVLY
jgi:hypothetical protein